MDPKQLFFFAALYNWAFCISGLFFSPTILPLLLMEVPSNPVWLHLTWVLVGAFGLGYYRVSQDPTKNWAVVEMGTVGKLLVVLTGIVALYRGQISVLLFGGCVGDLVFAVFFFKHLQKMRV
jgi:hypothetical protein